MAKIKKNAKGGGGPEISNRKARFEYQILETVEAGMELKGSEVKSLRLGQASLGEAYARIDAGKATLHNFQIQPYEQATHFNHDSKRIKNLLLHRREILKLEKKVKVKGQTLIPLRVYFNEDGRAKIELALAIGKKLHDKRQDAKKKQDTRDMQRAVRRGGL
ncbi:MAG TPA: SsrA-binding protein SmpB [Phycisphaerae bacterium]|nr:SsrA-binding protein SmpB [Phycisphaerae bacterium]HRW53337.1 SsrA-binding protein SmpB [Phycisphaerae bacterium]